MYIEKINTPEDIKKYNINELEVLAQELREAIINKVSDCGGHLASNLGIVELTIALHYVFDAPKDKFVFDVSHQTYCHKMLTGRKAAFIKKEIIKMSQDSVIQKKASMIYLPLDILLLPLVLRVDWQKQEI